MSNRDKARHISKCMQLAILLEVTAEKPGNVNVTSSFEGTTFHHFLASSVAAGSSFEEAAYRGDKVALDELDIGKVGLGQLIRTCASDVNDWQHGGNTILGTIMLFMPIAVAAGMTPAQKDQKLDLSILRKNIDSAVRCTSPLDSVNLYEAVNIANPSGLNDAPDLDVTDSRSKERLLKENVTLFEVFRIASAYDDVCAEWVNSYRVTFDLAYPFLMEQLKSRSLKEAIVNTFLKILSERADTFIARKVGRTKAQEVSKEAKAVLDLGGLDTAAGRKRLKQFDQNLRAEENKCNPGTTADLTAAALAICTLSGYRP